MNESKVDPSAKIIDIDRNDIFKTTFYWGGVQNGDTFICFSPDKLVCATVKDRLTQFMREFDGESETVHKITDDINCICEQVGDYIKSKSHKPFKCSIGMGDGDRVDIEIAFAGGGMINYVYEE